MREGRSGQSKIIRECPHIGHHLLYDFAKETGKIFYRQVRNAKFNPSGIIAMDMLIGGRG
jgi:hypothetical protein